MRTEPLLAGGQARFTDGLSAMFNGAIFEAEFAGAELGAGGSPRAAGDEREPDATQAKTCKPTRNPCCHGDDDDNVEGTQAKTCKPTRNPCCRGDDDDNVEGTQAKTCKPTRNPCCRGDDDDNVEGTQAKTCKPTRNPCCREEEEQRGAEPRRDSLDLLTL